MRTTFWFFYKDKSIACLNAIDKNINMPPCDCNEDDELLPGCKTEDEAVLRGDSTRFEDGTKVCSHSNAIEDANVLQFASTEAEDTDDRPMVCG